MKKYISKNNQTMIKQTGPATPGTSVEKVHLGCRLNVALINRKLASTEPKECGPICRSSFNYRYA